MLKWRLIVAGLTVILIGASVIAFQLITLGQRPFSLPAPPSETGRLKVEFPPMEPAPPDVARSSTPQNIKTPLSLGKEIGKHLLAALAAMKENPPDFDKAKAEIQEAEATKNKTSYELFKLNEMWSYFYGRQKNYAKLVKSYEELVNDEQLKQFLPTGKADELIKIIAQTAGAASKNEITIEYGQRWLVNHKDDTEMLSLLTLSFYQSKNYRQCIDTFLSLLKTASVTNVHPSEVALQFGQSCAHNLGDESTAILALEQLVRYYPKSEYWKAYIRYQSQTHQSELAQFYWYQLQIDTTGALTTLDDYSSFAQLAISQYALPATAANAVTHALSIPAFRANSKGWARLQNLEIIAQQKAAAAKTQLPILISEAPSDSSGKKSFDLGMIYFDNRDYQLAINALVKGKLADSLIARMTIGISQLRLDSRDVARATFASVAADESMSKVARAWILRTYN